MKPVNVEIRKESWPIAESFAISRGSKTHADVLVVSVTDGITTGQGECLPYGHYGETTEIVTDQIKQLIPQLHSGITREELLELLPAGSARNALDCALWDFECKTRAVSIGELINIPLEPSVTCFTISLDTPEIMAEKARMAFPEHHILKLKCGDRDDAERLYQVREAVPKAELIIDANEGWNLDDLQHLLNVCMECQIKLVEQPLPTHLDDVLEEFSHPIPICADESFRHTDNLEKLARKYDAVNLKLDKTGGLTAALEMLPRLKDLQLQLMVGCMVSTSLSMAPAFVVAQHADYVDLDGALLLTKDRPHAMLQAGSLLEPPSPLLWG